MGQWIPKGEADKRRGDQGIWKCWEAQRPSSECAKAEDLLKYLKSSTESPGGQLGNPRRIEN